ncbi:CueP family metal-binding protein [Micromonospora sonneratiae]|uniref:CueP family metal-binding protein n=1 Tax=Micromonospora sonneratiae TaxID=1184706 RepID=A0ABW3YIN3_9ACTN
MKRLVLVAAVSVLLVTGCSSGGDNTAAAGADTASSAAPSVSAGAEPLLARYGLAGKSTVEVIDRLDRLGLQDRPADLKASVRASELVVSAGGQEHSLALPDDRFYLSVAPYVQRTHECFYHSLTTCKGELVNTEVQVRVVDDASGKVLVDEAVTTFANGFVGFWLPRGMTGTLRIASGGKAAETKISTGPDAPTCLTTLQMT